MIGSTRSNFYGYMLLLCMLTLMLALAWPASVAAQGPNTEPGGPNMPNPDANPDPPQGPGGGPPSTDGMQLTPVPTAPAGPSPTATATPDNGGDMNGGDMMAGPPASELANRIVKHVATPAQLVMAGAGFQYYFIGPDGSTVSGPTFPSFAELAEMHPSGEWVSLLDAVNPLSGKQVYVDYIPNDQKIRVFTYYPDKGMDVNKPYIFNFDSDLSINVEAW